MMAGGNITITQTAEDFPPNLDKALVSALKAFVESFGDAFGWGSWQDAGFYMESTTPFAKE